MERVYLRDNLDNSEIIDTFTCEDIVSFLSICSHKVYHWPLCNKIIYIVLGRNINEKKLLDSDWLRPVQCNTSANYTSLFLDYDWMKDIEDITRWREDI